MKWRMAALCFGFCAAAAAQSSSGYVYVAPGGATAGGNTGMTVQIGAGGEIVLAKRIGIGAEIGAVAPRQSFSEAMGFFSPNASYHFIHESERRFDPYVTGGYKVFFRSGHMNLFNVGVGANYWFAHRLGLKVEFRDQVTTQYVTAHFWGLHLGLAFR